MGGEETPYGGGENEIRTGPVKWAVWGNESPWFPRRLFGLSQHTAAVA